MLDYVRDDKPFGGVGRRRRCSITRAIAGRASAVTSGGYSGILQADAYDGYGKLYQADRKPRRFGRRRVGCMRGVRSSPWPTLRRMPAQGAGKKKLRCRHRDRVVRRIDALFEIERAINGKSAAERVETRQKQSRPLSRISMPICVNRSSAFARARSGQGDQYILNVGRPSRSFWTMAVFAFPTMPRARPERIALGRKSCCSAGPTAGRPRRGDVQPHHHVQNESCRSAGLVADVLSASPTTPRIGWMSWRRGTGRGGPGQLRSGG